MEREAVLQDRKRQPNADRPQPTPTNSQPTPNPPRAARYLMSSQLPSGDWPQQTISGVFNRNCMITYANYR